MTPERLHKVEELYHAARERDATLRAVYLHEACAGDDSLRREVETLLAQDNAGSSFEASPLKDVAAQAAHDAKLFGDDPAQSQNAVPEASPEQSLVGRQLGSYLVRAKIGEGGMGEVYRAFDTKLRRDVALKVLPRLFAHNPERLARFRREAQLLASLNHKNIAAIYGFEELPEANFLVLELVEGETFAERIKRQGPLPIPQLIKDALTLAGQVAEGLEAAHRKGITHRDIKPANIKVTPEGEVKVLDFGLAKAFAGDRAQGNLSELPTMEPGPTRDGQILGTPAYMSPEQVRGQDVDKRTDIWAFGCLLFELLTGQRVFQSPDRKGGGTVADIIAAVLNNEPDWAALPTETPASIQTLLRRCLQKDANRRLHDIADARIEIEEALAAPATTAPGVAPTSPVRAIRRRMMAMGLACLLVGGMIAGLAVWNWKPEAAFQLVSRTVIDLPQDVQGPFWNLQEEPALALSPDGRTLAYAGTDSSRTSRIYLRAMDSLQASPLRGTEGASGPFFSPDGQWIGFFASLQLKKVSVRDGATFTLTDAVETRGATWGPNDTIVFARRDAGPLSQVPAAGGEPQRLTALKEGELFHAWPAFLPGGQAILFTISSGANPDDSQIAAQRLDTGERRVLIQGGANPRYVPTGHLVYHRSGTLMAVPFDLTRLEVTGTPTPAVEGIMYSPSTGTGQFSFSTQGSLVYLPGSQKENDRSLVWVDRNGTVEPIPAPPRPYVSPSLSPDGRLVAITISEQQNDIWIYDLNRNTLTRLTFEGINQGPSWTPDGKRVVFNSIRDGKRHMYWKVADGSGPEELLFTGTNPFFGAFTPDGRTLVYSDPGETTGRDIWVLPLQGERKPRIFLQTSFVENIPRLSLDGRWLAHLSNESGRAEVYVRSFPGPGGKWQISTEGGTGHEWSPKGNELFYRTGTRREQLMAVDIQIQPTFSAGEPRLLFEAPYDGGIGPGNPGSGVGSNFSVAPDGQRFLMLKAMEPQQASQNQIHVVLNWFEELKRRVPAGQ